MTNFGFLCLSTIPDNASVPPLNTERRRVEKSYHSHSHEESAGSSERIYLTNHGGCIVGGIHLGVGEVPLARVGV